MIAQLKVGPFTYAVSTVERLTSAEYHRLKGEHDAMAQTIKLDRGMGPEHARVTLLHEALHAVSDERNLGLEENDVDQLAVGIALLFLDNPEFAQLFGA